eukprot:1316160-Karenia_brevis.AAC.1
MGYISISRVEKVDNFLLAQAFPPMLFRQGPQPGPQLLMEYLKGNVLKKDAKLESKDLTWSCCRCGENKKAEEYTTVDERHWLQSYREQILETGAWRVCLKCAKLRKGTYWCSICQANLPIDDFDKN